MTPRYQKRHKTLVVLSMIVGTFIAILIGQIVLVSISKDRLREYSDKIIEQSTSVSSMDISVLTLANESQEPPCSGADLKELRYILFHYEYLQDIGRTQDGYLLCTASWGRFSMPLMLPPAQRHQADGYDLWKNAESVMDPRLVADMAARGSAIVFTSPTAFKLFENPPPDFGALVLTRDGQHLFRSFGDTTGLAERFAQSGNAFEVGPRVTSSTCAADLDICVVTALDRVNILRQPTFTWLGIICLGGLAGGAAGLTAAHYCLSRPPLHQQIRRAIADGRLEIVYQPVVRLRDQQVVGVEALARLTDDEGRSIPPDIFVDIAEEDGFIGLITRTVIHKALHEIREKLCGEDSFHICINICAEDVVDESLCDYLNTETDSLGIPHNRVILEITERTTKDHARLIIGMGKFRKSGYEFYIDDFGIGYSSFAYLATLPIHGIKIDKMFTQAIGKEPACSAVVETICSMAEALGVNLVVEGIEEKHQASYVLGIHPNALGQGWLFGKPVKAEMV